MDPYHHPDTAALIQAALHEDLRFIGDLTCQTLVPRSARLRAAVTAKATGVVCGLPLFDRVLAALGGGVTVESCALDGTPVKPGDVVFEAIGDAHALLIAERTALNLCQRLSGTATLTRRYVDAVAGTGAKILDTRKTTPGMRLLQKHAVVAGGGVNHRIGLYDQVLIKENHIALMPPGAHGGGPAEAVRRCRAELGAHVLIEVEIECIADLAGCIAAGADIVLCDNLPPAALREAVAIRDTLAANAPVGHRAVALEASGGITLASVRAVAETGVDRISTGELTHSVAALDLSLRCVQVAATR